LSTVKRKKAIISRKVLDISIIIGYNWFQGEKKMILTVDPVKELEKKIIKDIENSDLEPHQRLAPERKLADIYNVPRMRVHQAIARLVEKGFLYSRRGSGTFLADFAQYEESLIITKEQKEIENFPSFIPSNECEKIRLNIPVPESGQQADAWKKVIAGFNERFPFLQTEVEFGSWERHENLDLYIASPNDLPQIKDIELNISIDKSEFSDKIFDVCQIEGRQLAAPILRVPPLAVVNLDILKRAHINRQEFIAPEDLMRIGAEVEEKTGIRGIRYLGGFFHGALYGLQFLRDNDSIEFDKESLNSFLDETKPYIKQHHFTPHGETGVDKFINGEYCIYPFFAVNLIELNGAQFDIARVKLPLKEKGFVCEGMFIGGLNKKSGNREEAALLLEYILSEEAQKILTDELPFCLSVRKDVLAQQEENNSKELDGIHTEFDIRSYYTQRDLFIFDQYGKKLNTESGKYFWNMQSLEKTIERLKRAL
jgi:DNA-binding transcriptional regulator YhcF (GntR family)/ABC-type glycerol-3-phosphate transport system substrate-binding protein